MKIPSCGTGGAPEWIEEAARVAVQIGRLAVVAAVLVLLGAVIGAALLNLHSLPPWVLYLEKGLRP